MFIDKKLDIEVLNNGLHLSPDFGSTFMEELNNIHEQIDEIFAELKRHVVLIVYFIDALNEEAYHDLAAQVEKIHTSGCPSSYSIIAQRPADGKKVNVEVYHCCDEVTPEFRQFEGFKYCAFSHNNIKYLVAGGLQLKKRDSDPFKQSTEAFRLMKGILHSEKMDFSTIFRQWNYIESITCIESDSQRYQIFNDVRSQFYSESDFIHGYPAATGIGMNTGGIIIDFLAADGKHVWPVRNPAQVDAHKYSGEVLANNKLSDRFKKTTPKFERAKAIAIGENILIFISGTAAIKGEISIAQNDAYLQTLETVDNIRRLVSIQNMVMHHVPVTGSQVAEPVSFRIYAKRPADLPKVRTAFESKFGKMKNVQYLIADICRPELLVEIEGTYKIKR